ncbi:hypothetical protein TRFO_15694 [Tritrichomonas foetus]|uniref:Uncharacterized protein n=1 Tax=Tritrichomonas foetus TaxID=1144522 RepID=A0A1J4KRZ3_9EUKA|nr:hypothetical protein TRFO_15694 [Tritrichomonas foetus]|eukprot:OHT14035.1 hypothetical protein TRFO_15694 [Tritrichomonas foetus]
MKGTIKFYRRDLSIINSSFSMENALVTKVVVDIILQVEGQIKAFNEIYQYSKQKNSCYSNYLFSQLPRYEWIKNILSISEINQEIIFDYFYEYASNSFDQIVQNPNNFCDWIRFSFYASILYLLPKQKYNIQFSSKYINFLLGKNEANTSQYFHKYCSIKNLFYGVDKFCDNLFIKYYNENKANCISNYCEIGKLLIFDDVGFKFFLDNAYTVYELLPSEQKTSFLQKFGNFLLDVFVNFPQMFEKCTGGAIQANLYIMINDVQQMFENNNADTLPIICPLLPLIKNEEAQNYAINILYDFKNRKQKTRECLKGFLSIYQNVLMTTKPNPTALEFVKNIKPILDDHIFKDANNQEIFTEKFIELFLPRYIALDLAYIKDGNIPISISYCIKNDDPTILIALIRGLILSFNGYPNQESKHLNFMVNIIFNIYNNSILENIFNQSVDRLHNLVFTLISGNSALTPDYQRNSSFLDLVSTERGFTFTLFFLITNELPIIGNFSSETIISFFILCYEVFDNPQRWFSNFSKIDCENMIKDISIGFIKMYKRLFIKNLTVLPYFDMLLLKFLNFVKVFYYEHKIALPNNFFELMETVILLVKMLTNEKNAEYLNEQLSELAMSMHIDFPYKWPLSDQSKEVIIIPTLKIAYILWIKASNQYSKSNNFAYNLEIYSPNKKEIVSIISFQSISMIVKFLCENSIYIEKINLLKYKISQPSLIFLRSLIEFISNEIKDDPGIFIDSISQLDKHSALTILKSILSKHAEYYIHPNCLLAVTSLTSEENKKYTPGSFDLYESIILSLLESINMDSKFKDPANKGFVVKVANLLTKIYSGYTKFNELPRLTIISIILNFAIITMNDSHQIFLPLIQPLPLLFKNFVISAENLSPCISQYENKIYIQKTLACIISTFCLITSASDEASLKDACQECLNNILKTNFSESWGIFSSSFFNVTDPFKKVILKAFISAIKSSPSIIETVSGFKIAQLFTDNFQKIIDNNKKSIRLYEMIIEEASFHNKLRSLFISMCSNYEKPNSVNNYFFIAFFKIAATQGFINSLSLHLFKMNVEKTISAFIPPIQFVYYWQLCAKITKQKPFDIIDKFFFRPVLSHPQLYNLDHKPLNQYIDTFINKIKNQKSIQFYLEMFINEKIDYFEVFPIPHDNTHKLKLFSHFMDEKPVAGNYVIDIDKVNPEIYRLIDSQCIVCIDQNTTKNEKWLFILEKLQEDLIPFINGCFAYLFSNIKKVTLYIDMRNPPPFYIHALETILVSKVNVVLTFIPFGVFKEIESQINKKLLGNLKLQSACESDDVILPFHISTCLYQIECLVNGKPGSINFFQEHIIILGFEQFRGSEYPVSTCFNNQKIKNIINHNKYIQIDIDGRTIMLETNYPKFIIEAIERSNGSLLGITKYSEFYNFDPKVVFLALSLLDVPNYDSIVSETSLELFYLLVSNEGKSWKKEMSLNSRNVLSLPLDGLIKVLQEKNLFESVALFLAPFISIISEKNMQTVASLLTIFLSTCKNETILSGICHHLITQFNDSSSNTKNDFQLLYIWSTTKSDLFTKIAIPQIAVYVESSVAQSQLIYCLSAKNKVAVNECLIETLIFNDLTRFKVYKSLFTSGLYSIFPSVQFLGKDSKIVFLSLLAALSAPKSIAQPFVVSLHSFLQLKGISTPCELSHFEPESTNILLSSQKIFESLSTDLQNEVSLLFSSLTPENNPDVWYLKPNIATFDILNAMTESIVPEVNLKKLVYCLASLEARKCEHILFWTGVPFLQSAFLSLRRLSINIVGSSFLERNISDPLGEISATLKLGKNLKNVVKMYGSDLDVDFENELSSSLAENLLVSIIDVSTRNDTIKLIKSICNAYMNNPETVLEFIILLIAFSNQFTGDCLKHFNKCGTTSPTSLIKATIAKKSYREVIWIVKFLVWGISQASIEHKFSVLSSCLLEVLRIRADVASAMKSSLMQKMVELVDSKEGKDQEAVAQIAAVVCAQKPTKGKQIPLSLPFPKVLEDMHVYSYCVNFYGGIKEIISK